MSDRPPDRDPPQTTSTPASKGASTTSSPAPNVAASRPSVGVRSVTSPVSRYGTSGAIELPPLPSALSSTAHTQSPSTPRLASFSSILNPAPSDQPINPRRRKASELASPRSTTTASLPPILNEPHASQTAPGDPPLRRDHGEFIDRPPRRILTPRSPSLHRAASTGQLNPQPAKLSALTMPYPASSPRSRTYAIEPGTSGVPPLPTTSNYARAETVYTPVEQSAPSAYRGSVGRIQTRNLSSSASPSTSYSSYSQTSPTTQYPLAPSSVNPGSYMQGDPASSEVDHGSMMAGVSGSERQRPMGIPISSSGGQNVYQMMTLETTSGTVQLPVDVQAASRVADEKRRRNAGASARFRQRRKEKEKEASTTISRMEQQIKEVGEDAEFYRRERDYLAGVLSQIPGCERHFPRPPSPRHRRSSTLSLPGPSGTGSAAFPTPHEQIMQTPEEGRNVRRRTSTMSLPPPPPPLQMHQQGTPMQPAYAQQPFGQSPGYFPPPPSHRATSGGLGPPAPPPFPPEGPSRHPQKLPALPQVLQPPPQWGGYPSSQAPPDPNQPRDHR